MGGKVSTPISISIYLSVYLHWDIYIYGGGSQNEVHFFPLKVAIF